MVHLVDVVRRACLLSQLTQRYSLLSSIFFIRSQTLNWDLGLTPFHDHVRRARTTGTRDRY